MLSVLRQAWPHEVGHPVQHYATVIPFPAEARSGHSCTVKVSAPEPTHYQNKKQSLCALIVSDDFLTA